MIIDFKIYSNTFTLLQSSHQDKIKINNLDLEKKVFELFTAFSSGTSHLHCIGSDAEFEFEIHDISYSDYKKIKDAEGVVVFQPNIAVELLIDCNMTAEIFYNDNALTYNSAKVKLSSIETGTIVEDRRIISPILLEQNGQSYILALNDDYGVYFD